MHKILYKSKEKNIYLCEDYQNQSQKLLENQMLNQRILNPKYRQTVT